MDGASHSKFRILIKGKPAMQSDFCIRAMKKTTATPPIALIDMDGTLCDYRGAMEKTAQSVLTPCDIDIWDNAYSNLRSMIKKQPGFWRNLEPMPVGYKIYHLLRRYNYKINILTKGPYHTTSAWSEKVEWCRQNLDNVAVTITEDKSLVYGKILVDDFPAYCEAWLEWRPRGLVLMPAHDYNEGFDKQYPNNVLRIDLNNMSLAEKAIAQCVNRKNHESLNLKSL